MHVSLVTPVLGRDGGVAAHVLSSARALEAAGYSVTVVAGRRDEQINGSHVPANVISLSLACLEPDDRTIERAVTEIQDLQPDVIHLHDLHDPRLTKGLRRVAPVVASAHGYPGCAPNTYYFAPGHECERSNGPLCLAHMAFHGCLHARDPRRIPRLYRLARTRVESLRCADATVAYSRAVVANLVRNGVTHPHLVPLFSSLDQQETSTIAHNPGLVVFAGRIVPAKGLEVLIRALPDVHGRLAVCGDGWATPVARQLAHELGVNDRIDFLGWLADADLDLMLQRACVVALPSIWPEPFGLIGLEAMARSVPVVGSNTGGIPEWLIHEETGMLVEPGDPRALASAHKPSPRR